MALLTVPEPRGAIRSRLPLVTIVTPSYNQGRFIRATIESVLSQDYPNIEYIVMDGLSKDETAEVCGEYLDRLTFISEKDRGQSDAINKGFKRARGEIVAWLNSDDVFLPGAISRAVETFLNEPDLGAVYGEGYQIDIDGNIKQRFAVTEPFNLWKLVYMSDYILQQTVFFRRSVFEEIGYIDQDLHYGMDWEILMRIGKSYNLRYIPYDMGSIREHGEAKTSTGGDRRFRELAKIMRRHGTLKIPPGCWIYGAETYSGLINDKLEKWLAGERLERVRKKLQSYVVKLAHRIIYHQVRKAQGLFADGWAAKRVRYMLPPGHGRFLRVDVTLPEGMHPRQELAFRCEGKTIARHAFGPGSYELFVRVPEAKQHVAFEFEIVAKKSFRPPATTEGRDDRKLTYLISSIGYDRRRVATSPRG